MTNKEILANAPEGATHFIVQPINIVYLRFSGFIEGQLYCNHKKGWRLATHVYYSNMRSLSDIKRIVELEGYEELFKEGKINHHRNPHKKVVKIKGEILGAQNAYDYARGIGLGNMSVSTVLIIDLVDYAQQSDEHIVELESEILGLKNQIQNQQMCIFEHNSALVGAPVKKIGEQGDE